MLVKGQSIEYLTNLEATSHFYKNRDMFSQMETLKFLEVSLQPQGNKVTAMIGEKINMKLPHNQYCMSLHNVVLVKVEGAPAKLLRQGTLLAKECCDIRLSL